MSQSGNTAARADQQAMLLYWQNDPDLAGIRDREALAQLPADERQACEKFWSGVAELLNKVKGAK
jgi:hypothetical protein